MIGDFDGDAGFLLKLIDQVFAIGYQMLDRFGVKMGSQLN